MEHYLQTETNFLFHFKANGLVFHLGMPTMQTLRDAFANLLVFFSFADFVGLEFSLKKKIPPKK